MTNTNPWQNCQLSSKMTHNIQLQGEQQRREASGGGKDALEEKKIFYAEKVGALLTFVIND